MKELNSFEKAAIKRTAQNVSKLVVKKNKLKAQIEKLQQEYNNLCEIQEDWEAPIKKMTEGLTTEDLVERVVEDTGKLDKDGRSLKITKWVFKEITDTPVEMTDEQMEDLANQAAQDMADNNELPFID